MKTAPSTLVLDFGGVISKTLFETRALSERALGLEPGQLTWQGPFALETDPLLVSMQADEISERDYWLTRAKGTGALIGETLSNMSDLLIATYTKVLKPAAAAYQALIAELDVTAQDCVFVDDQHRNIAGAQAVGMQTVHLDVMNPAGSYAEAERLLGLNERTAS